MSRSFILPTRNCVHVSTFGGVVPRNRFVCHRYHSAAILTFRTPHLEAP